MPQGEPLRGPQAQPGARRGRLCGKRALLRVREDRRAQRRQRRRDREQQPQVNACHEGKDARIYENFTFLEHGSVALAINRMAGADSGNRKQKSRGAISEEWRLLRASLPTGSGLLGTSFAVCPA